MRIQHVMNVRFKIAKFVHSILQIAYNAKMAINYFRTVMLFFVTNVHKIARIARIMNACIVRKGLV